MKAFGLLAYVSMMRCMAEAGGRLCKDLEINKVTCPLYKLGTTERSLTEKLSDNKS